jgi:predicted glycoside hydrolase/deacetylase ChbG (UPF0249 family)
MALIINADDFGLNEQTNTAIVSSFEKGLCSSTTIMANMPGFEEACRLAYDRKLLDHIGIHFVLTAGMPLTQRIKKHVRFCTPDGRFRGRKQRILYLSASERESLVNEFRAQVAKCRKNGIKITHADSHHNIHEEWAIASAAMLVCREQNIPYIRLARNCGSNCVSMINRVYRHILNYRLKRANLAGTRYFGSVADYVRLSRSIGAKRAAESIEIMVHPVYNSEGILVEWSSGHKLDQIEVELNLRNLAVSYSGRRYNN